MSSEKQCDYLSAIVNTIHFSRKAKKVQRQQPAAASELTPEGKGERVQQRLQILLNISQNPRRTKWYYLLVCLLMCVVLFLSYLFIWKPNYPQYRMLEELAGVSVTQQNSFLVEYPLDCYFLVVVDSSNAEQQVKTLVPLDDSAVVEEVLEERMLEVKEVEKEGFLQLLAISGSEDPQADYILFAYMYFPDLLTPEEMESFSIENY